MFSAPDDFFQPSNTDCNVAQVKEAGDNFPNYNNYYPNHHQTSRGRAGRLGRLENMLARGCRRALSSKSLTPKATVDIQFFSMAGNAGS